MVLAEVGDVLLGIAFLTVLTAIGARLGEAGLASVRAFVGLRPSWRNG